MIALLGVLGVLATLYAISVEKNNDAKQKALCDINEHMSCSRVLKSPYARMVGMIFGLNKNHPLNVPNTYYGLLFYVAIILYSFYPFTLIPFREVMLLFAASGSILASFGLACILYFKLKDFCVVCVTTYVINGLIFWCALYENKLM
jgi:vitamin-K-epoxide reductase (warfarin-sensitive)